jgi:restriction system protein
VSALLKEIYKEGKALREIRPRQLEELIAELLRDQGMEIHITPETRDGGRDVIARGEFIQGEPMVLAVEVKQKSVVGIQDLYNSLKPNEDYPALLLATSGRFSAGVIQEKKRRRNELRLILKDGVALSQWIAMYGAKRSR